MEDIDIEVIWILNKPCYLFKFILFFKDRKKAE